jgi:uncharacterized membrane protein
MPIFLEVLAFSSSIPIASRIYKAASAVTKAFPNASSTHFKDFINPPVVRFYEIHLC